MLCRLHLLYSISSGQQLSLTVMANDVRTGVEAEECWIPAQVHCMALHPVPDKTPLVFIDCNIEHYTDVIWKQIKS